MKSITRILFLSGVSMLGLLACQKELSTPSSGGPGSSTPQPLTLSDTSVKLGQAVLATLPSGTTSNAATWTVSPDSSVQIAPSGQSSAYITFSHPGKYNIIGHYIKDSVSGTKDSCVSPITVVDSSTAPPGDTATLVGVKFVIVPNNMSDSGLVCYVKTVNTFQCGAYLATDSTVDPYGNVLDFYITQIRFTNNGVMPCSELGPAVATLTIDTSSANLPRQVELIVLNGANLLFTVAKSGNGYSLTEDSLQSTPGGSITINPAYFPN